MIELCPRISRGRIEQRMKADHPVGLAFHPQLERAVHEAADAAALVAMRQRLRTQVELDTIAAHEIGGSRINAPSSR